MIDIPKDSKVYNYIMFVLSLKYAWDWDDDNSVLVFEDKTKLLTLKIDEENIRIYEKEKLIFSSENFILAKSLESAIKNLFEEKIEEMNNENFAKEIENSKKEIEYLESKL